jgi:head-tail adaptor
MRRGRLRNTAAIEQTTQTQDAIGGTTNSWSAFCAQWPCELVGVSGGEVFRGRQVHANATYVAVGGYVSGVTTKHRVTLSGRTFEILRSLNADNKGRELRLELMERGV